MGLANIDLVEILFTLFWVFFVGLVLYIRREDKREGYPLQSDRSEHIVVQGFPAMPEPKEFKLPHGGTSVVPRPEADQSDIAAEPAAPHPGAPLVPTGDPMLDGVGPGSYSARSDTPDLTLEGLPRVVPLRVDDDFHVESRDPDPRGMDMVGADGESAGKVQDLWVDRSEPLIYYLEVALAGDESKTVLVPYEFAKIDKRRGEVVVDAVYSDQFAKTPALQSPDQITRLEEDKICAFYAGGTLYADDSRQESIV